MSTQRRENRGRHRSCKEREGELRLPGHAPSAQYACAHATVGTAPPLATARFDPSDEDPSLGPPARLATNSLPSDYRTTQIVRLVHCVRLTPSGIRHSSHGSPPPGGWQAREPRHTGDAKVIPLAHSLTFRVPASLPGLAVIPAG